MGQVVAKPGPVLLSGGLITSRLRLTLAQPVEGGIEHTLGTGDSSGPSDGTEQELDLKSVGQQNSCFLQCTHPQETRDRHTLLQERETHISS